MKLSTLTIILYGCYILCLLLSTDNLVAPDGNFYGTTRFGGLLEANCGHHKSMMLRNPIDFCSGNALPFKSPTSDN